MKKPVWDCGGRMSWGKGNWNGRRTWAPPARGITWLGEGGFLWLLLPLFFHFFLYLPRRRIVHRHLSTSYVQNRFLGSGFWVKAA